MDLALAAMAGLAVLWIPGAVAARRLLPSSGDPLVRFAQQCALGLAVWPILFLWTTTLGLAWNATGARLVILAAACWLFVDARAWRFRPHRPRAFGWIAVAVAALVIVTRIRQIRGVALPIWVDSVHHTMILRLLLEHGRLPDSYAPFIPESTFYYHWGFHAIAAFAGWLSGMTSPGQVPRLLLGLGQLLNVLVFFAVYAAGATLFRNRRTALLAATLATLVSLFPAYYVSWGRYTQLCGILLLPPIAIAFWRLGRRPSWRRSTELAILATGLVLIHVRVAIVFAVLAFLLTILLAAQRKGRGLAWCAATAIVALLAAAPWLVQLARTSQVRTILAPAVAERGQWETSNAAPDDLLWAPHNDLLFAVATGGLLGLTPVPLRLGVRIAAIAWWLVLVAALQRRHPRVREITAVAVVVVWVAVVGALINLDRIGLPRLRVIPNSAGIILLFLPVSLIAAELLRWAAAGIAGSRRRGFLAALTVVVALAGASQMLDIINPATVLATAADRRALEWIRLHTPATARFAVGVQPWIGGSFVGTDGGYWISLVADRPTNLPPGLYRWVMPAARIDAITRELTEWYEASQAGDLRMLTTLRSQHVTHVYFGPRNTTTLRSTISASPRASRVYVQGGVEIYELR